MKILDYDPVPFASDIIGPTEQRRPFLPGFRNQYEMLKRIDIPGFYLIHLPFSFVGKKQDKAIALHET